MCLISKAFLFLEPNNWQSTVRYGTILVSIVYVRKYHHTSQLDLEETFGIYYNHEYVAFIEVFNIEQNIAEYIFFHYKIYIRYIID